MAKRFTHEPFDPPTCTECDALLCNPYVWVVFGTAQTRDIVVCSPACVEISETKRALERMGA